MSAILPDNSLSDLLVQPSQDTINGALLTLAQTLGLPVTSWKATDPTRILLLAEATFLATREALAAGYISSGFLDYASGEWLAILAKQVFGVDVPGAQAATGSVTLTNAGGGVYELEPGDLTFTSSSGDVSYTSTSGGTLTGSGGSSPTLTVTVVADTPGAVGSAAAHTLSLVTTLLGVSVDNPDALVGLDAQDDETTRQQCRDKAPSLSACGPAGAYSYVARSQQLTGVTSVSRVRVYPDSDTGNVQIYVAGANDVPSGGDVAAVQSAIDQWATPACFAATVSAANPVTVNVTYSLWVYASAFPGQSTGQIQAAVEAAVSSALASFFAARPIGGDIIPPATTGALYQGMIEAVIGLAFPAATFRVLVSAPSIDTSLGNGDVPILGTVSGTVNPIAGP